MMCSIVCQIYIVSILVSHPQATSKPTSDCSTHLSNYTAIPDNVILKGLIVFQSPTPYNVSPVAKRKNKYHRAADREREREG